MVSCFIGAKQIIIYTKGVKHTARGPNPARCVVGSGPWDDFVK